MNIMTLAIAVEKRRGLMSQLLLSRWRMAATLLRYFAKKR